MLTATLAQPLGALEAGSVGQAIAEAVSAIKTATDLVNAGAATLQARTINGQQMSAADQSLLLNNLVVQIQDLQSDFGQLTDPCAPANLSLLNNCQPFDSSNAGNQQKLQGLQDRLTGITSTFSQMSVAQQFPTFSKPPSGETPLALIVLMWTGVGAAVVATVVAARYYWKRAGRAGESGEELFPRRRRSESRAQALYGRRGRWR